jgi:hypothetical protein
VNGQIVKQNARMRISVNDVPGEPYRLTKSNGELTIRIGDPDYYLKGRKDYVINYSIELFDDKIKEYDSIYLNLIPKDWETTIEDAFINISLPKDADVSGAEFIGLTSGITSTDIMTVSKEWPDSSGRYTLSARSNRPVYSGEGITFRTLLPEGYFIGARKFYGSEVAFWIVVILAPLLCLLLWFRFGRDDPVRESVELRPPEGLTPAEIGLLWDAKIHTRDLTSMFLYWANKGYISIEETGASSIKLYKLEPLGMGAKPLEKEMFSSLFAKGDAVSVQSTSVIGEVVEKTRKLLYAEYGKEREGKLFERRSLQMRRLGLIISLLPVVFNMIYAFDSHQTFEFGAIIESGAATPVFIVLIFIFRYIL